MKTKLKIPYAMPENIEDKHNDIKPRIEWV